VDTYPSPPIAPEVAAAKYLNVVLSTPSLSACNSRKAGAPRPLEDFLRCSKASERRVRRVAWRLKEVTKLGGKLSIEDYVKTLAARVNLPASIARSAVELLERNRRVLAGKNPWVSAAALWLASFKRLSLLKALADAAGTTPASVRNAANRLRV
jgi:transcription initiation factor TFIIIB Brf1 subunit/transcription initiation factor TFIIB